MAGMNYRSFGNTGLQVSEIGLGCSNLGGGVFFKNDSESIRVLNLAFELGVNFFDTADSYGYGHSEEIIGRTFKNRRNEIYIASKVGMLPSSLARIGKQLLPILPPLRPLLQPWKGALKSVSKKRQHFSSAYITQAVEQSLKRLRTDYLDVYQLHNPPTSILQQGEVFETLDDLRHKGKIRFYGVSANTISDALLCLRYSNISSLQVAFNLLEREAAEELLPQSAKHGIALIARVPLGRGLLTSKMAIQTGHTLEDRRQQEERAKVKELSFLERNGVRSISQAAILFVLHHPQISVVIPGTRSIRHLEQNIGALTAPPLTVEELKKLNMVP
jgi:aryl-alcohol dehydrogenase-like predicted oxidoreductase